MSGAAHDDLVDGCKLADEAFGDASRCENSGLTAMAYLWRRFGPPVNGNDEYKDLAAYYLTTSDEDVVLGIRTSGSPLRYGVFYIAAVEATEPRHFQDGSGKWQVNDEVVQKVNRALVPALRELLVPVFIRDVPINILGVCEYPNEEAGEASAEPSQYAGYGIPEAVMEAVLDDDDTKGGE